MWTTILAQSLVEIDEFTLAMAFVILGIIMVLIEVSSPGFFIAVPGTILIVLGLFGLVFPDLFFSVWSPVIVVIVGVIASLGTLRLYQRLGEPAANESTTSADTLVGRNGIVVKAVEPGSLRGKVRIASQVWSATADVPLERGTAVTVIGSEGVHVIVKADDAAA